LKRGPGNTYVYKINGILPYLGEVMNQQRAGLPTAWADALSVARKGNDIALVEIDSDNKAVAGGIAPGGAEDRE